MEFLGIVYVGLRSRAGTIMPTILWEAEAQRVKNLPVMELHQGQDLLGAAHKIWKTSSQNLEATMQVSEWCYKGNSVKVTK